MAYMVCESSFLYLITCISLDKDTFPLSYFPHVFIRCFALLTRSTSHFLLHQTPDAKKEEYRKYLEKSGVVDSLTKGTTGDDSCDARSHTQQHPSSTSASPSPSPGLTLRRTRATC